jgi:chromosome partitioning protein
MLKCLKSTIFLTFKKSNNSGDNMAKVVSFSNQKGGVGKTTSCVNIAAQIANKGKKVLMIDMDPQGNATSGLGLPKSKIKNTIFNI